MLDSTVWQLSKEARILWITLLLKKDRDQVVRASVPGLAHAARLTLSETEVALKELQKPDPYSQSQEQEGRRVIRAENGWLVVNGEKYRNQMTVDDRREYNRLKQQEYRAKKKVKTGGQPLPLEQAYQRAADRDDGSAELMETLDKNGDPPRDDELQAGDFT